MLNSSIVVTGATGYIGSQIVFALLSRLSGEVRLRVIARNSSDCSFLEGLPVDVVRADISDSLALLEAFRGADTVFHCAGFISYTRSSRSELYDVNVVGARNVVNACIYNNVRRLVLTSSIAAIGASEDGSPANESTIFQEWQRRNGYMEAKHLAELEGLRGVAEGLEVVMVNPGVVIGIDHQNPASLSSSNEVLRLISKGKLPLFPSGSTGFVDVRDVADAHLAAWERGRSGERYLVVGRNLSFRELFDALRPLAGSSMGRAFVVPGGVGLLAGFGGEIWSMLSSRPSFISLESIRLASRSQVYNNSKSRQELGFSYRDLSETLKTLVF